MSKATGLGGVVANKGGMVVSFKVGDTSLAFVNCHLAAHQGEAATRNANVKTIMEGTCSDAFAYLRDAQAGLDVDQAHDHVFWMGDMNYRVDWAHNDNNLDPTSASFANYMKIVYSGDFSALLKKDQLIKGRGNKEVLDQFQEGPITFPPTFKFKIGAQKYSKQRLPAWCDRVLWKSRAFWSNFHPLQQLAYSWSPDVSASDHKPVYSTFQLKTYDCHPATHSLEQCKVTSLAVTKLMLKTTKPKNTESVIVSFHGYCLDAFTICTKKMDRDTKSKQINMVEWPAECLPRGDLQYTNILRLLTSTLFVVVTSKVRSAAIEHFFFVVALQS